MKGIILAGGTATRLAPLTKVTNKHLLPIYDKPMIYYPLEVMRKAGIENILIVSGKGHSGHFLNLLGSGKEFGARLSYEVQEEAGGIAQALGLAEDFADGENIAVILGDNVFQDNLASAVKSFDGQKGAKIFLKQVHDPHRFGVAEMRDGKILSIEEKPKNPKSDFAVTGIYMYDARVFNAIKMLKPSGRGELEITDVNNFYIKENSMSYEILNGWWTDAGTFDSLLRANMLVAGKGNI